MPTVNGGRTTYTFAKFLSYDFVESYLQPCAGLTFALDEDELSDAEKGALVPASAVSVSINDQLQCSGFIDAISNTRT